MSDKNKGSVLIDGFGTYAQGEYDDIKISGSGNFTGDITCKSIEVSGKARIEGNLEAKDIKISGKGKVMENITCDTIVVTGMTTCYGNLKAGEAKVAGYVNGVKKMKSNTIKGNGFLKVEKEIDAETLDMNGVLDCEGSINCEELNLTLLGTSDIGEIGGSTITVKTGTSLPGFIREHIPSGKFQIHKLNVDTIEGDTIYLENCKVNTIRANKIVLGKHCEVEYAEYEEGFEKDSTSIVRCLVMMDANGEPVYKYEGMVEDAPCEDSKGTDEESAQKDDTYSTDATEEVSEADTGSTSDTKKEDTVDDCQESDDSTDAASDKSEEE